MLKFNLLTICFILNSSFIFAQNKNSSRDNLYDGVTINLTPSEPFEAHNKSAKLYNEIKFHLISDVEKEELIFKMDSIIINLKSGVSWELLVKAPKNPPFFLIQLIINRNNKKVTDRLNYLRFNSLCEQKPESVYKSIESFEVYRYYISEDNINRKYLFYYKLIYNDFAEFKIIEKRR